MKKILFSLTVMLIFTALGCGASGKGAAKPVECTAAVSRDEKFDSAVLSIDPEEFTALGFCLGDSVDIAFESAAGSIVVCQNGRGLLFDEALAKKAYDIVEQYASYLYQYQM